MVTLTVAEAVNDFSSITRNAVKKHEIYRIHRKKGEDIVLMSEEEYDSLQETLYLQSQPGLVEGVKEAQKEVERGEYNSFEEFFGEKLFI